MVADVLATIKGHAKGHLDLKDAGREDEVVRLALDVLGPGQFIITTLEDRSVAAIRSRFESPDDVPVALSARPQHGRGVTSAVAEDPADRAAAAAPAARLRRGLGRGRASACPGLGRAAVPPAPRQVMVWTVNSERELRYWLSDGRANVVITDRADGGHRPSRPGIGREAR